MTGDLMRRLAEVRPAHLDPEARVAEPVRRAELARAMAAPRPVVRSRTRVARPAVGLGVVGAAAAAAVAVAVATSGTGPAERPKQAGGGSPSTTRIDARTVLLSAASVRVPASSGKFWHVRTVYGSRHQVGPANRRYVVEQRTETELWEPTSPKVDGWYRDKSLGAKPASPADEAAWRADGSPSQWTAGPVAKGKAWVIQMRPTGGTAPQRTGKTAASPESLVKLQRRLGNTPPSLEALRKLFVGEKRNGKGTDEQLFETATGALLGRPLKPAVRSGVYRLLAEIKGVTAVSGVRDPLGRPGVALQFHGARFIMDPATATALAKEKPQEKGYFEVLAAGEWVNTLPF